MNRVRAHGLRLRAVVTMVAGVTAGGMSLPCEHGPQAPLATVPPALSDGPADAATSSRQRAWVETYAVVARLADAGSVEAARMALEMHRHGSIIYGMRFEASDQQLRHWRSRIVCTTPPCVAAG